jgi:hypothetical protein
MSFALRPDFAPIRPGANCLPTSPLAPTLYKGASGARWGRGGVVGRPVTAHSKKAVCQSLGLFV